ncbi:MAG: hypothetical protein AAB915_01540 [Patescibacteria group bacterium]
MVFDFFLAGTFLASAAVLWYRISLKIPELVAVPDTVIVERLHEDSAQVRIFLLHFKKFYREGRHRAWLWRLCEKICHRAHIFLLRADNATVALLQKIRVAGNGTYASLGGNGIADHDVPREPASANEKYWLKLRQEQEAMSMPTPPRSVHSAHPARQRTGRIQEVRARKKEKMPE